MPSLSDASPYVFGILILAISLGAMLTGVYVMFTYQLMQKIYDDSKKDRDFAGEGQYGESGESQESRG